eukprot:TRINITY_DN1790_c0_g1_i1.p1 TRINITY_DN1790_c0_g1~~TRINITY_DN1790_c0_g1_i1.p1  ORF type:complete len:384 (+),score=97.94 TRINITY_DN1790_c0_g1_i1:54-1154(+)
MTTPPPGVDSPLHAANQTIATLLEPAYWAALCPSLSCTRDSAATRTADAAAAASAASATRSDSIVTTHSALRDPAELRERLVQRGFFRLAAPALADVVPPTLVARLAEGVAQLRALGHPASAIGMYDEAWELAACVSPLLEAVSGNEPLGDWFTFFVHHTPAAPGSKPAPAATGSGWAPHRDRPASDSASFRSDGTPKYTTVWIALSDATPESSCLYVLPREADPGYDSSGDALAGVLATPVSWQRIVAQPCAAGGLLCFSHRLLHWGSQAEAGAAPRIALSFAFADRSFEAPFFSSADFLPFPPLALRLGLRAGQAIAYQSQVALSKAQLALETRIFHSQKRFFSADYADKVASAAQFAKFLAAR